MISKNRLDLLKNITLAQENSWLTVVHFTFILREKCVMHFSCSVDENSSKFQISRTKGKVFCHLPKREEGTVGELVIQRPAQVPFHALPLWDFNLYDIKYV